MNLNNLSWLVQWGRFDECWLGDALRSHTVYHNIGWRVELYLRVRRGRGVDRGVHTPPVAPAEMAPHLRDMRTALRRRRWRRSFDGVRSLRPATRIEREALADIEQALNDIAYMSLHEREPDREKLAKWNSGG